MARTRSSLVSLDLGINSSSTLIKSSPTLNMSIKTWRDVDIDQEDMPSPKRIATIPDSAVEEDAPSQSEAATIANGMRWQCILDEFPTEEGDHSPPWRDATFNIQQSDIELSFPPPVIDNDTFFACRATAICGLRRMLPSPSNPDFLNFGGFCMWQESEHTECIVPAIKCIDDQRHIFGEQLAQKLCQQVRETLADADRPTTSNAEHLAFFERHQLCRHLVPMAGEANLVGVDFVLLRRERHMGVFHVNIVDGESKEPIKADGFTLMLAMEQIMKQRASFAFRQYFEHVVRHEQFECNMTKRANHIMDPNNTNVLVGDLIPLSDGKLQRFIFVDCKIVDDRLVLEMNDDSEFATEREDDEDDND